MLRCPNPKYVRGVSYPCGKPDCLVCMSNKVSEITSRVRVELVRSQAYFITLTYDDDHLPGFGVDYDLMLQFFKLSRLRFPYLFDKTGFKYILVGEYGGTFHRPHYHLLFFFNRGKIDSDLYSMLYEFFQFSWPYGNFDLKECLDQEWKYVCKYHVNSFLSKCVVRLICDRKLTPFYCYLDQYNHCISDEVDLMLKDHRISWMTLDDYILQYDGFRTLSKGIGNNVEDITQLPDGSLVVDGEPIFIGKYYRSKLHPDVLEKYYQYVDSQFFNSLKKKEVLDQLPIDQAFISDLDLTHTKSIIWNKKTRQNLIEKKRKAGGLFI